MLLHSHNNIAEVKAIMKKQIIIDIKKKLLLSINSVCKH